jgi:hypothetical protein
LRPADDRATHRHPLPLATGELPGTTAEHVLDAQGAGHVADPLRSLVHLDPGDPQREADVVADVHVRVEAVVLEDHGDTALARREIVGRPAVEQHRARGRDLQARDHPQ